MAIIKLKCPLNEKNNKQGPITNTFYGQHILTDEEIRLYEKLAPLPKPEKKSKDSNESAISCEDKMPNKEEKQRRKKLLEKMDLEKRFPNDCFCEDKLFLESEIVETKIETWYRDNEEVPQEIHIYKCSQCGKKYDDEPVITFA